LILPNCSVKSSFYVNVKEKIRRFFFSLYCIFLPYLAVVSLIGVLGAAIASSLADDDIASRHCSTKLLFLCVAAVADTAAGTTARVIALAPLSIASKLSATSKINQLIYSY
jgi:hypothetical protein